MPTHNQTKRKQIRLPKDAYRSGHPFFITFCTHRKRPRFVEQPSLSEALVQIIKELSKARQTDVYAWCVMPDHVHLLIKDADIQSFVRIAKGRLTPIARQLMPDKKLWQRSFYDHAVRRDESLHQIAIYIWNNPVRRGLVKRPSRYAGSGSLVWPDWRRWFIGRG